MMRLLPLCLLLIIGCAAPHQKQISVKPASVVFSKASLKSTVAPGGSITVVPKDVGLQWNPSTNEDDLIVSGYNLYYDIESRFDNDGTWPSNYSNVVAVGTLTNTTLMGLHGGTTYYFAATAIDQNGAESDLSAEASYTTPLFLDLFFVFDQPVTDATLQASPDLSQWADLDAVSTNGVWRVTGDPTAARFYRGKATSTQ